MRIIKMADTENVRVYFLFYFININSMPHYTVILHALHYLVLQ